MAATLSHGASAVFALMLAISVFAAMQAFRTQLAQGQAMTILGGFLGANIFVFLLTAVGNMEMEFLGHNFQTKLVPEVLICLLVSLFASALVHRVCITTCFLFACAFLYFINRISSAKYAAPVPKEPTSGGSKKFK